VCDAQFPSALGIEPTPRNNDIYANLGALDWQLENKYDSSSGGVWQFGGPIRSCLMYWNSICLPW
jgi:hypothetical protein